ncbi:MAG: phosphoribosylamine--glycine ligase, partial [Verrucomicrobiota bacterium]
MAQQEKIDVLILGSGGREHALLKACLRSPRVGKVRVAPGNGGMALEAECLPVDAADPAAVLALVRRTGSGFVIVGPEVPLAAGVVDVLEEAGVPAYGPRAAGARLEASKAFTKEFLFRHRIPTAASATFTSREPALAQVRSGPVPVVIKASGLAAGKGVVIATTHAEAENALRDMMGAKVFGAAGDEVVVEEFMQGEEASIMLMVCGEEY